MAIVSFICLCMHIENDIFYGSGSRFGRVLRYMNFVLKAKVCLFSVDFGLEIISFELSKNEKKKTFVSSFEIFLIISCITVNPKPVRASTIVFIKEKSSRSCYSRTNCQVNGAHHHVDRPSTFSRVTLPSLRLNLPTPIYLLYAIVYTYIYISF